MHPNPPRQKPVPASPHATASSVGASPDLGMVGRSVHMALLRSRVARVATAEGSVVIGGPSGAGKELVARALHRLSPRREAPFVEVNCGAFPRELIESELFGHERGAYTGAVSRHNGLVGAVEDGTLFLDEIAELELPSQTRLLRLLEQGTYRRVGSTETLQFRGRVVAATHAPLLERVREGSFREDLYYRLNVLTVSVPPLAARREDIPELVAHFSKGRSAFTAGALAACEEHHWPGNVRELRNLVERLCSLADGPVDAESVRAELALEGVTLTRAGSSPAAPAPSPAPASFLRDLAALFLDHGVGDRLALVEQLLVEEALRRADGNKSEAGRLLGVHRKVIERHASRRTTPA